jgi:histidine triad (HIT) family protein
MPENNCIFCKIITGEIPSYKVYEDDSVIAFLDINPVSEGHTLVVPKDHFEKFDECSDSVSEAIGPRIRKISKAVSTAVGADGYNLLCNNGRAAGQLVGHVHFHIIPRNNGDGILKGWPAGKYDDGRVELVLENIRKHL